MSDDPQHPIDTAAEETETAILKAHFVGRDGSETSNVLETDENTRTLFSKGNAVEPPIDPVTLAHLFEMSGALRSNIDAYCTNIDGFGYTFEPMLDLDDDETAEKVKQAMIEERILGEYQEASPEEQAKALLLKDAPNIAEDGVPTGAGDADEVDFTEPTDAEVKQRIAAIDREMLRERMRLERFFEFCSIDESFTSLRMRTRQDLELLGNAYWEVLRNADGDIVQLTYIPSFTMRLLPQDEEPLEVEMPVRTTAITETTETVHKRFRRFIQVVEAKHKKTIYFKEFGDPRTISAKTGKVYKDENDMKRSGDNGRKATEVIHFKIHNSRTPYGMPRWISEMLSVLGNRHADEINLAYFENRAIPPMILTVSGGRVAKDNVTKFENFFKNQIRGKRHHHSMAIVEAESAGLAGGLTNGTVKLDVIKLRDVQQDDAQFLNYKERNTDALGSVFRMPRLLRGDTRDFNRATAQTALEFAEQQVFGPLRKEFDFIINRKILTDFGVRFWRFQSSGPDFTDPNDLLTRVSEASKAGYMTPNELREIAAKGFKVEMPPIEEAWAESRPLQLTIEALKVGRVDHEGEEAEMPAMPAEGPAPEGGPTPPGKQPPGAAKPESGKEGPEDGDDDESEEAEKASDPLAASLRLPSPHDYAAEASRVIALRDYADIRGFMESHDEENG